ncbi:hypothetical protein ACIQ7D_11525 [Streptomyces sp. NPDC096310]|uniref:hypothetical protein n=1 Tax=Streptomyces sp. NPDC096310 TaxID=3366082 RepID=UPI0037FA06DE
MRGDDAQRIAAGGDGPRVRKGPRHAAPKKSLLTKLQIPAGKAMALAAMPTAVFVGMGLTPRLAMAEGSDDIPFAPGPCVTRSDEPSASASESPSPSAPATKPGTETETEKPGATPSPSASETARPDPSESGSGSGSGSDSGSGDARKPVDPGPTATSTTGQDPKPAPTKSTDPLDPLGLGDALGDLLGVPDKDTKSSPAPSPSASATDAPEKGDAAEKEGEAAQDDAKKPSDGASTDQDSADDDAGTKDDPAARKTEDAIREAARKAGAEVEELGTGAKGLKARADDDIPAGAQGKEPYPCPTADPDALAAATEEQGLPLLPDDPWTLRSSLLTLNGLDYRGIVEVRTYSGKVKKVLKFTASSVDIGDLDQTVVYPQGRTAHVEARKGSTSTIRDGEVTMYTEELKGNLFGLIPITFSPATPPPLNVPFAFFTDVKVVQAGQFGGTLTIPGLHNYITG